MNDFKIDAHCDVLMKLLENPALDFVQSSNELDVTLPRLKKANMLLQFFAIFIPTTLQNNSIEPILKSIDLFQRKILNHEEMSFVRSKTELQASMDNQRNGALLHLEGVDGLAGNFTYLRILYDLGLRSVGITWNHANWAADGVMEPRKGGFTTKGKELIKLCNELGMILDVSHLSVKGFWELTELSRSPFIASHSNAYQLCPHPRNLHDDQIRAIISMEGRIGITFVPMFVAEKTPTITDVIRHIEHICSLGGENHIGFGSDFDGIEQWIPGLENTEDFNHLEDVLSKHFNDELVKNFLYRNWTNYLLRVLPHA